MSLNSVQEAFPDKIIDVIYSSMKKRNDKIFSEVGNAFFNELIAPQNNSNSNTAGRV